MGALKKERKSDQKRRQDRLQKNQSSTQTRFLLLQLDNLDLIRSNIGRKKFSFRESPPIGNPK